MGRILQEIKIKIKNHSLQMRIGVHTGNIYGGIIGQDIIKYDIFGKDVVIAEMVKDIGT